MIAEVKGARLLQGFRGRPAADLSALADALVRVSHLAMHLEGHLADLDINPLIAAVRSGSEGSRRPRRVPRHIALHVAESDRREPVISGIMAQSDNNRFSVGPQLR
jgi:ATP-grasp domain